VRPTRPAAVEAPAPTVAQATPTAEQMRAASGRAPIAEVRLTGGDIDVAVTAPGDHVVGRASEAGLRIQHPTVSRRHAKLTISAAARRPRSSTLGARTPRS
jgi:hypothetical protein